MDVGIPAHGRPEFLVEAIESVLAQTLTRWRLTVSDDGPGGGEVEAAVRPFLHDPRIRYVATGENVGASRNMNLLIQTGDAPYVALLHDDDRWRPRFLELSVGFLENHPECGLVFSGSIAIDAQGRELRRTTPSLPEGVQPAERFVPLFLRTNVVPSDAVVVRRSAYQAVGPAFDSSFRRIYDYEMWFRIATRFPIGYVAAHEAEWRNHGAQSSFEGRLRGEERVRFLDHAEGLVARNLPGFRLSRRHLRRTRSRALVTIAIDALETDEPARAARTLAAALRMHPPSVVDPQVTVLLLGLAGGAPGRRAVGALRLFARRRHLRVHVSR